MRAYIGGIARQNGMTALAIGGTADHVHLLMTFDATTPLAKTVQLIKAGSSKWFRESHQPRFRWQEGYAAFTVSKSHQEKVAAYIRDQERHHRKRDFREEMMELFRRHAIHADDRWFN
jgi:putative transposase